MSNFPRFRFFCCLGQAFMLILLFRIVVYSQTPTATITGQVKDASGAALIGARVIAKNVQTNIERVVETSGDGDYTMPLLSIGEYRVSVEKSGFKRAVQ